MFGKGDISSSYIYGITNSSKSKDGLPPPKYTLKDDISCIIEEDEILPRKYRKYGISFYMKRKEEKLVLLT